MDTVNTEEKELKEVRCIKCNGLLCKNGGGIEYVEIKCRKCGYINKILRA